MRKTNEVPEKSLFFCIPKLYQANIMGCVPNNGQLVKPTEGFGPPTC